MVGRLAGTRGRVKMLLTSFGMPLALVLGAMIGSFLNVVIHRMPRGESIVLPGSRCPRCARPLSWWENVPILSYFLLGGHCRTCRTTISWRYPAIEAACALLFAALYARFGASMQFLALAGLVGALVAIFWIDLDTMMIHDAITIPGILGGLAYSALITHQLVAGLAAAGGAILGLELVNRLVVWLLNRGGKAEDAIEERQWGGIVARTRKHPRPVQDALGGGDVMLAAMLALWFGWRGLLVAFFIACVLGSGVGVYLRIRRGESLPFPFGPFIVAGALVVLFSGDALWSWYVHWIVG